jgi:hypothetical protein
MRTFILVCLIISGWTLLGRTANSEEMVATQRFSPQSFLTQRTEEQAVTLGNNLHQGQATAIIPHYVNQEADLSCLGGGRDQAGL